MLYKLTVPNLMPNTYHVVHIHSNIYLFQMLFKYSGYCTPTRGIYRCVYIYIKSPSNYTAVDNVNIHVYTGAKR